MPRTYCLSCYGSRWFESKDSRECECCGRVEVKKKLVSPPPPPPWQPPVPTAFDLRMREFRRQQEAAYRAVYHPPQAAE